LRADIDLRDPPKGIRLQESSAGSLMWISAIIILLAI